MIFDRKSLAEQSSEENLSILSLVRSISSVNVSVEKKKKTSAFRLPSVPKHAGVFLQQFVKTVFSMTNPRSDERFLPMNSFGKKNLTSMIQNKTKRLGSLLKTQILSDESNLFVNVTPKDRQRRSNQRRLKMITNNNNSQEECRTCRRFRNVCPQPIVEPQQKKLLTDVQRFEIASAVETIFNTMLSLSS